VNVEPLCMDCAEYGVGAASATADDGNRAPTNAQTKRAARAAWRTEFIYPSLRDAPKPTGDAWRLNWHFMRCVTKIEIGCNICFLREDTTKAGKYSDMPLMNRADQEAFFAETTAVQRVLGARQPYVWIALGVVLLVIGISVMIAGAINIAAMIIGIMLIAGVSSYPLAVGVWSWRHPKLAKEVAFLRRKYTSNGFDQHTWQFALAIGPIIVLAVGAEIGLRRHNFGDGITAGALAAILLAGFFGTWAFRGKDRL
jgi:hypothetical protein